MRQNGSDLLQDFQSLNRLREAVVCPRVEGEHEIFSLYFFRVRSSYVNPCLLYLHPRRRSATGGALHKNSNLGEWRAISTVPRAQRPDAITVPRAQRPDPITVPRAHRPDTTTVPRAQRPDTHYSTASAGTGCHYSTASATTGCHYSTASAATGCHTQQGNVESQSSELSMASGRCARGTVMGIPSTWNFK